MSHAILEPIQPAGTARIVALPETEIAVPSGLSIVDVSGIAPAPQLNWITRDGGKTFADPMAPVLANVQAAQIQILRTACRATITGGFESAALGAPHTYPSADTDQRNLQAARGSSATPLLLMCADMNGVWALLPHVASQAEQVNADWIAFRQAQQEKLVTLTAQVNAATSVTAVKAIVWPAI